MVLAALAAGRANGLSWLDAVRLSNIAAGLEVQVFGVQPMPIEVIHREALALERGVMHAATGSMRSKVMSLEDVLVEIAAHRSTRGAAGGRHGSNGSHSANNSGDVVFTNGCFDILHPGHVSLLTRARAHGGERGMLIVGVNSDDSVRRLKGPTRPVNGEQARTEVLAGLQCVDAVVVFDDDTPERLIRAIKPDVLVKGNEYTEDKVPGAAFVRSCGGRVELLAMVPGQSTTGTIRKMQAAP
jgi:D-beta-D-heptose 7-phosphate kinase / D-beta-D-heptose 1-phosphate adenosyltransferase